MSEQEEFCGFICDEYVEKQQEIIDEINNLRKYNPEFANEFSDKLINMLQSSKK